MIGLRLQKTGGSRKCHQCEVTIPKGSLFILQSHGGKFYSYSNFCPACGVKMLKRTIKDLIKHLNDLTAYLQWDN